MEENFKIQDKGGLFGGIAKSIGSLFGGRARRRRERKAQKEFASALDAYKTSEISKVMSPSKIVFGFEGDATNQQVGLGNDGIDSNLIRKLNQKS